MVPFFSSGNYFPGHPPSHFVHALFNLPLKQAEQRYVPGQDQENQYYCHTLFSRSMPNPVPIVK